MDSIIMQDDRSATLHLERLHQAAIIVAGAHDIDEALQAIVDAAREAVGAGYAALGIPGEPGQPMRLFVVSGVDSARQAQIGHPPVGRGLLGELLRGQTIRIADITAHRAYTGYPDSHPPIRSFLGVPIQIDGQPIADLYLANKLDAGEFSQQDEQLAEMLAAHAAVVIRNLHYQEQARQMALYRERETIARQLQDDVLQQIYGIGLMLRTLDVHSERADYQLARVRTHLDTIIERLRQHLLDLAGSGNGSHEFPPGE